MKFTKTLSRDEMKQVMGGYMSTCTKTVDCVNGSTCECSATNGSCEATKTGVECTDDSGTSTCNC